MHKGNPIRESLFVEYFMLLLPSVSLAICAYFSAWEYFWSGFKWTPFGYETCGLEGIVWYFGIPPLLILSFVLKFFLVRFWNYPKIFWIFPLVVSALLFMFTLEKGYGQGIMSASFIISELCIDIYSAIKAKHVRT